MYDDEAKLIELLGERYPDWRSISDDPEEAARILQVRLPRASHWDLTDEEAAEEEPNLDYLDDFSADYDE